MCSLEPPAFNGHSSCFPQILHFTQTFSFRIRHLHWQFFLRDFPLQNQISSEGFFRICRMRRGGEGGGKENLFDFGDPFRSFQRISSFPSPFGGRDPFDDAFFSRPFGSMLGSEFFSHATRDIPHGRNSEGPVIEELNSDDEGEEGDKDKGSAANGKLKGAKHQGSTKAPSVQHPDDDDDVADDKRSITLNNKTGSTTKGQEIQQKTRSFSVHSCKVTYGGVNGAYYTSSRTRRAGTDGVVFEESKEADKTTGQATHKISRGINDKGHTVTRKLNADGKVDTMQMLHNLEQDELNSFEEAWRANSKAHLPNSRDKHVNRGESGRSAAYGRSTSWDASRSLPSPTQSKKVVRINID